MHPVIGFFWAGLGAIGALILADLWRLRREKQRLKRSMQRLRDDRIRDRVETEWERYIRKYEESKARD
jgi:hypothetical protein